jgi:hypothetical protein
MSTGEAFPAWGMLHLLSDSPKSVDTLPSIPCLFKHSKVLEIPPKAIDKFRRIVPSKRAPLRLSIVCLLKTRLLPIVISPCMEAQLPCCRTCLTTLNLHLDCILRSTGPPPMKLPLNKSKERKRRFRWSRTLHIPGRNPTGDDQQFN